MSAIAKADRENVRLEISVPVNRLKELVGNPFVNQESLQNILKKVQETKMETVYSDLDALLQKIIPWGFAERGETTDQINARFVDGLYVNYEFWHGAA